MNKTVFLISNYSRKPKFQTQTRAIREKSGDIVFQKMTLDKEALPHLLNIKKTSNLLIKMGLGSLFCEAITRQDSNSIVFRYVSGEDIESLLLDAVLNDDDKTVSRLLDEYEAFLKNMVPNSKHKHHHTYKEEVFGPNFYEKFHGSKCIYPGILDFNFDNIVKASNKLKAIDYEWAFEHCLPYDYILARAIMWFGIRYSDILKMHSERINIMAFSDEVVIPAAIVDKYPGLMPLVKETYLVEWSYLQRWVNNPFKKNLVDFHKKPIRYIQKSLFAVDHLELQEEIINQLNTEKARLSEELLSKNIEIERQNHILRRYPHRAVSKVYRVGGKAKRSMRSFGNGSSPKKG